MTTYSQACQLYMRFSIENTKSDMCALTAPFLWAGMLEISSFYADPKYVGMQNFTQICPQIFE